MTEITELVQREKFEAWARSQQLSLTYGDCGYVYSSTEMAWRAVKALSSELVEALEKAQRANAAQDYHINQQQDRIESLEKKNAELGKYVGELESRTVKLPKKNIGWDRDEDDCWNNAIDACAEVLSAAGIKVEAE